MMADRQKSYKFNPRIGGVSKLVEDMRKSYISKRKQERFNLNGGNRPTYDDWGDDFFVGCSFESVSLNYTPEEIVHQIQSHPCLNENSIYPEGYLQSASDRLKNYIKSANALLRKQRDTFKIIEHRYPTCYLTADKLPIFLNSNKEEISENDMDTSEAKVSSNENDIRYADVFIDKGSVECFWKIWLKLIEFNSVNSTLFELLIEFVAFISSLRPSYFDLSHLGPSYAAILHTIKLPSSADTNIITNFLFFLYNISEKHLQSNQPLPSNFQSFVLLNLIPAVQEKFHTSTLTDTHSTSESTIKFFMGISCISKIASDFIKETDEKIRFYQDYKPFLVDCVKIMIRSYPVISLNFSSILADYSDFDIDILTQQGVYYYLVKAFRDPCLYKNATRMALNLAKKLDTNEFQNFLITSNFFVNFAESLKHCKTSASGASYTILKVIFERLPLAFIAGNLIDSGLFYQICEFYFWGSMQDIDNFFRIVPIILSCEHASRYVDQLLETAVLDAFFHALPKASDNDISNAIFCVYTLLKWSRAAGKFENFKEKVDHAGVINALWQPEVTSRGNRELEEKRIEILKILHGEFAS